MPLVLCTPWFPQPLGTTARPLLLKWLDPEGNATSAGALNSAVECHPHTVEVIGSNPIAPTTHRIQAVRKLFGILRVDYKFLLAPGLVRGNITESSVAARSGATFRA